MSEPKTRTTADIQNEYNNLAFKAGNLQFELQERKRNLDMINDTLRALSTEYVSVKQAEDAAQAEQAKKEEKTNETQS